MTTSDVLVIGVGGMGSSACLHLARRGLRVTGIEQFELGHARGSSHGQSRVFRQAYFEHPSYVPLLKRSYQLWSELSAECGKQLYHETGLLYVGPKKSALIEGVQKSASDHQLALEKWSPNQLKGFQSPPDSELLFEPKAGYLEVENCVLESCALARKSGAEIIAGEKIRSWSATPEGVSVTTDTQKYAAKKLILTAGAWTSNLLPEFRLSLTLRRKWMFWLKDEGHYLASERTPCFLFEMPYGIFYGFPNTDGQSVKMAEHSGGRSFTNPDSVETVPAAQDIESILRFAGDGLPRLTAKIIHRTPCTYTMTPDENFIVDRHPHLENVFFAAGFSGHGFKFSSVIGEILADLATDGKSSLPIDFLRRR